nr:MAG TPA: hypothetical protein [Caudoviricetes sp.]
MVFSPIVITLYLCDGRVRNTDCSPVYDTHGDFNLDTADRKTILKNCCSYGTRDVIMITLCAPDDSRIAIYEVRNGELCDA